MSGGVVRSLTVAERTGTGGFYYREEDVMHLTTTKERVLDVARALPGAEKALRALHPEAFKPQPVRIREVVETPTHDIDGNWPRVIRRTCGQYAHVGVYLGGDGYRWEIRTDDNGARVLLAFKE